MRFLEVKGRDIFDGRNMLKLRGVNFGGWLMLEGYILGGRNIPAHEFYQKLFRRIGANKAEGFIGKFRENFITEEDMHTVKSWGLNCVRLPINYRLIYEIQGIEYLKNIIKLFKKNSIYVILDLHAAPGSQNNDWHSDSSGEALLWQDKKFQDETVHIWQIISRTFKNEPAIAGYDLINEPVIGNARKIRALYDKITRAIRNNGDEHIIFLEGGLWAQDFKKLDNISDKNTAYSMHFYQPLSFVFNFRPGYTYPGHIDGRYWDKTAILKEMQRYVKFQQEQNRPMLVGEFGINSRCPQCNSELKWLNDTLAVFNRLGFSWAYWTYKAVANMIFPDGVLRLLENHPWVKRDGPVFGWENIPGLTAKQQKQALESFKSSNFVKQEKIIGLIKKYAK